MTKTDDNTAPNEHTQISSGSKRLQECCNDSQGSTEAHTHSSSEAVGLTGIWSAKIHSFSSFNIQNKTQTYNWATEEPTSNDSTDRVRCINASNELGVVLRMVKVGKPVGRALDGVVYGCIITVKYHACRCHHGNVPEEDIN